MKKIFLSLILSGFIFSAYSNEVSAVVTEATENLNTNIAKTDDKLVAMNPSEIEEFLNKLNSDEKLIVEAFWKAINDNIDNLKNTTGFKAFGELLEKYGKGVVCQMFCFFVKQKEETSEITESASQQAEAIVNIDNIQL